MKLNWAAIAINGVLIGLAVVALFPLLWMLSVSFMAPGEASTFPPPLIPHAPTLANYRELFAREGMGRYFANSLLLATFATLLSLTLNVMAGYFQLFAEPYVMTQGGPLQSTVSVLYFMYEEGFKWWNLGFASAIAFILFVLMFAVTLLQLYVARLRESR